MTGIWGILNVTPDSFSDGGRYSDVDAAVARGLELRRQGATVLDIGGESTRPGAKRITPELEQARVLPVIEQLAEAGVPLSIDTLNASTAIAAVRAGAQIVNDVSGGMSDPKMHAVVAESGADYAIGHWRGPSADMYALARYNQPAGEVAGELRQRIIAAVAAGIAPTRLIIDPGIGFAKAGSQNWDVLRGIEEITALGPRVLLGTSRKRFLAETLSAGDGDGDRDGDGDGTDPDESRLDLATAVTSALAARAGVWAVRVHNVAATRDALAVAHAWEGRS